MTASNREYFTRAELGLDIGLKLAPRGLSAVETHISDVAASVQGPGENAVTPRHQGILHEQQSRHGLAAIIPVDLQHPTESDSLLLPCAGVGHEMHGSRRVQAQVPQAGDDPAGAE